MIPSPSPMIMWIFLFGKKQKFDFELFYFTRSCYFGTFSTFPCLANFRTDRQRDRWTGWREGQRNGRRDENSDRNLINPVEHTRVMTATLEARICRTKHLFKEKGKRFWKEDYPKDKNLRKERFLWKMVLLLESFNFCFTWKYLQIMWRSEDFCCFCLLD